MYSTWTRSPTANWALEPPLGLMFEPDDLKKGEEKFVKFVK